MDFLISIGSLAFQPFMVICFYFDSFQFFTSNVSFSTFLLYNTSETTWQLLKAYNLIETLSSRGPVMSQEEECRNARKNPRCPYLLTINKTATDITSVKKALLGDLETKEPGLIEQVRDIRQALRRKWTAKDYGTALLGIAALITALAAIFR
jgi:hypothetical protein